MSNRHVTGYVASSDFAPCDFYVSEPPKKNLLGKRISTDVDVKQAVTFYLYSLDNSLSYVGQKFRCHAEANSSQL
jgi:hypothetical protein